MRIPKCVDCRWYVEGTSKCRHPDAELDVVTGKELPKPLAAEDMRVSYDGPCGIEGRLFDLKVDPLR